MWGKFLKRRRRRRTQRTRSRILGEVVLFCFVLGKRVVVGFMTLVVSFVDFEK
jgi:hypothetical protein